ncbi:hypothetical protein SBC1_79030 (plasmid) [Caballeronia sp. SBC1]|nr:hypothetical protein SBC1_79030 [Caballeronia sp. SBC1]
MRNSFGILRFALFIGVLFFTQSSFAQDSDCSPGNQDNTCLHRVTHAMISPPTCSTAAGWTTVTAAKWIGSGYTSPACNYQSPPACSTSAGWFTLTPASWNGSAWSAPQCTYEAPPTCSTDPGWNTVAAAVWTGSGWTVPQCSYVAPPSCPSGYSQTAAPSWNGSAWTGLGCEANTPPVTQTTQEAACAQFINSWQPYASTYPNLQNQPFSPSGWSTVDGSVTWVLNGPYPYATGSANSWSSSTPGVTFYYNWNFGQYTDANYLVCGVQQGTNTVVGMGFFFTTDSDPGAGGDGSG